MNKILEYVFMIILSGFLVFCLAGTIDPEGVPFDILMWAAMVNIFICSFAMAGFSALKS